MPPLLLLRMAMMIYVLIDTVFGFLLGAACASFFNVLVSGSGDIKKNLARKRSMCESCDQQLRWWELIPVLSWLCLKGRCARCGKPIPWIHPISELVVGLAFVSVITMGGEPVIIGARFVIVLILYFFSMYDVFHRLVPNSYLGWLIFVLISVRVIFAFEAESISYVVPYVVGSAAGFAFFWVINVLTQLGLFPGVHGGQDGFGWGDAKYSILVGLILGWPASFLSVWIAVFGGAIIGVAALVRERRKGMTLPFIPFLSGGAFIMMVWGGNIVDIVRRFLMY